MFADCDRREMAFMKFMNVFLLLALLSMCVKVNADLVVFGSGLIPNFLGSSLRQSIDVTTVASAGGFRVVSIPEPSPFLYCGLVAAGLAFGKQLARMIFPAEAALHPAPTPPILPAEAVPFPQADFL
jgi:hypothetical protein